MLGYLKQSTASQSRMIGPFVDDTDFKTAETGLTIANTDIKLSKNGAAGVNKNFGGGTHRNNGMYSVTFDATDTDTVGELEGSVNVAGALIVPFKFVVLEEAVYDALFAASANGFDANGRVDVGSVAGTAQTANDNGADINTLLTRIVGTLAAGTHNAQSGDAFARIGANGAGLTAVPWNASWDAEVESEANDALVALGLDHLVSAAVAGTDVADNSIFAKLVSSSATADWDDFVNTTDALQALRDFVATLSTADKLLAYVQLLARSDAAINTDRTTELGEINTNEGSGVGDYDNQAEAQEAIRDRGDSAWITGGGGGLTQSINPILAVPPVIDLAGTASVRIGIILTNTLDDLPTTAEITPGTITIARKAQGGTSWSNVVSAAAMSEQDGLVYYDEVFDSGSGYAVGDMIRIQFESVSVTADSNTYNITGATGVYVYSYVIEPMRGTDGANTTVPDAAGTAPTAVEIRQEMDSNSTKLAEISADLPSRITKNVALNDFTFLMVDETDHVTAETGLTVSGTISKDGAAFGALTNSVVEIGNGMYGVDITQAEMNADSIILRFTATGADDRFVSIMTQPT